MSTDLAPRVLLGAPPRIRVSSRGHSAGLVGRELQLMTIQGRLQDPSVRLVSVIGPGGVGKSRLAVEASRTLSDEFARGIRLVDLNVCDSADAVNACVDRAVAELAGNDRALLLLDGVEHRTRELAPLVAGHLALDSGLTVLATGQEALRIYGERLVPVAPLTPPGQLVEPDVADVQDNPAVQLFVQRAHEVNPDFTLTAENVEAVVDICNLLEGVPLSLELAAARLRLFPVHELRAWLHRGGDSHLAGPVDVPARQRSMHAIVEWSCQGITDDQRALLVRLALFERGATLATVEKVSPLTAADTSAAIEALLDRSLVSLVEQPRAESRLTMSRTIRAYGLSVLEADGTAGAAREVHARHFLKMMRTIEGRFHGSEQERWLRVAGGEHENVLAALEHFQRTGDLEAQSTLLAASLRPWLIRGRLRDGLRWFDGVAEAMRTDETEAGLRLRARLYTGAGYLAAARGDHDGASHRHRRAVAVYKQLRDVQPGARASARMGLALLHCGERAVGQSLLAAARSTLESLGDTAGSAEAATGLAEALIDAGQLAEAKGLLDRALRIYRQNGEIRDLAGTLLVSARLSLCDGDEAAAQTALRECLRLYDSIDDRSELPAALEAFALLIQDAAGQPQRATRLLAAAESLRRRADIKVSEARRVRLEEAVDGLRRQLGWTVFATAWTEGLRLWPESMAAEALAAGESGNVADRAEATLLTPRQLQVALLVAEGMTNRQIANQLCIAEWTVVNHVRHVMRKLGCNSRVQVAWAVGRRQ